ncbi:hypothetical protein ACMSSJ_11360 [Kerstersia gyiorum]|uniref:hypothetical protein n=1 Tax=Kerstersia gyiorum TaxID=206506 RepID=UPI0030D36074
MNFQEQLASHSEQIKKLLDLQKKNSETLNSLAESVKSLGDSLNKLITFEAADAVLIMAAAKALAHNDEFQRALKENHEKRMARVLNSTEKDITIDGYRNIIRGMTPEEIRHLIG